MMVGSLHMGWRHVLFANWPVEPPIIESLVPDAVSLDTYNGEAWLSIVPFTNIDVRPPWLPSGWGYRLPELNLRTYVVRDGTPGVYFFSLDAQGVFSVLGARLFHHLPYYYARIRLDVTGTRVRFESKRRHPGGRPARFRATYKAIGDEFTAVPGTLAEFLTERYRYYTEGSMGRIRTADVRHGRWPLYRARVRIDANTVFSANGFDDPDADPMYLYSPGVDTIASANKRA